MVLKFSYLSVPGRGEAIRIILTLGNIAFLDHRIEFADWPALKPTTPLGNLPTLTLDDGRVLCHSGAVLRYAAKLAGLYPKDDVTVAFADQWTQVIYEALDAMATTHSLPDVDAKIKARLELLAGKVGDRLKVLDTAVEHASFLAGNQLSYADIAVFAIVSNFISGYFEGVPSTLLDDYPHLKAWHQKIANIDAIKAYYADATGLRLAYKAV